MPLVVLAPKSDRFRLIDLLTTTKEGLNVRRLGSPRRPTLRTFVWAWFQLPKLASKKVSIKSNSRRNPIALAKEWKQRLEDHQIACRAELARQLGVSRAHVTQVLSLLSLAPEVQCTILALGDPIERQGLGIRALRALGRLPTNLHRVRLETCLLERIV